MSGAFFPRCKPFSDSTRDSALGKQFRITEMINGLACTIGYLPTADGGLKFLTECCDPNKEKLLVKFIKKRNLESIFAMLTVTSTYGPFILRGCLVGPKFGDNEYRLGESRFYVQSGTFVKTRKMMTVGQLESISRSMGLYMVSLINHNWVFRDMSKQLICDALRTTVSGVNPKVPVAGLIFTENTMVDERKPIEDLLWFRMQR